MAVSADEPTCGLSAGLPTSLHKSEPEAQLRRGPSVFPSDVTILNLVFFLPLSSYLCIVYMVLCKI